MNGVSTERGIVRGVQFVPDQNKIICLVENLTGIPYIFLVGGNCDIKHGQKIDFFTTSLGFVKSVLIGEYRHSAYPLTPEFRSLYGDGIGSIANLEKPKTKTPVSDDQQRYYYFADGKKRGPVTALQLQRKFSAGNLNGNSFLLHKSFGVKSRANVDVEDLMSFDKPPVVPTFAARKSSQSKLNTTGQRRSLKLEIQKRSIMPKLLIGLCIVLFGSWAIASDLGSKSTCANAEISMAKAIRNLQSSPGGLQQLGGEFGLSALSMGSALLGGQLGDGRIMAIAAKDQYPRLPLKAGCTILYWDLFLRSL